MNELIKRIGVGEVTDKELLELAAKAAGYKYSYVHGYGLWASVLQHNCYAWWNPLTNDGDAFRLAVSLGIFDGGNKDYMTSRTEEISNGLDPYVATRRAIVRAAAEIGRTK